MGLVAPSTSAATSSKLGETAEPISANDIATAVKDTFINRTAISPQTYPDIFGTLTSYAEGVPTVVEYFKKRISYGSRQTIDTSFSLERAAVHSSYDLVHNFEIRIKDQLVTTTDPESTETSITGECIIYPGFNPNPGDAFYLRMPDEKIGLFVVDLVTPLSIYRGTHFLVNFHMYGFLDAQIDAKLRTSVVDELYFEKQNYFSDEAALLSDVSYNQLNSLISFRKKIIDRIITLFLNKDEKTVIRPDHAYDAYLVEFLTQKIGIADTRYDVCQICNTYIDAFDNTIWAALLKQDITQLVYIGYRLFQYKPYLFDTNLSNIDKFNVVFVTNNQEDPQGNTLTSRLVTTPFSTNPNDPKVVSYHFSDRLYYAIIRSFEDSNNISDIVPFLTDISFDSRIFPNLQNSFYSVKTDSYHEISFFDTHNKSTGSNNDLHLPELEFLLFDYLMNNNIDISYLVTILNDKFPFPKMSAIDQFYYLPILLHLIDVSIPRIR